MAKPVMTYLDIIAAIEGNQSLSYTDHAHNVLTVGVVCADDGCTIVDYYTLVDRHISLMVDCLQAADVAGS
jgi:hypothetical protein